MPKASNSNKNRNEYLKLRGEQWYLNLPIPKRLRHLYRTSTGKEKIVLVRALHTSDPQEARRLRDMQRAQFVAQFRQQARKTSVVAPEEFQLARKLRDDLIGAANAADFNTEGGADVLEAIYGAIAISARQIAKNGGSTQDAQARAHRFASIASGQKTLRELFDQWIADSGFDERTTSKNRLAFVEFLDYLKEPEASLSLLTFDNAQGYARWLNEKGFSRRGKTRTPLSYNTKRDRIAVLRSFWNALERQRLVSVPSPWRNLLITRKQVRGSRDVNEGTADDVAKRRAYRHDEMLALLNGPELRGGKTLRYGKRTLLEVYCLGFLTGARLEEFASLRLSDISPIDGGYVLRFRGTKNAWSDRDIPVLNKTAVALLEQRLSGRTSQDERLFAEFIPGPMDERMGHYVGKALGRYRKRLGLARELDTHGTRRTFITLFGDEAEIKDHVLRHYVGHSPLTVLDRSYREITFDSLCKLASRVAYPAEIEQRMAEELGLTIRDKAS